MTKLEVRTPQAGGYLTMSEKPLGKGGEGAVHSVVAHSVTGLPSADDLVVKVYYKPNEGNRREKVISMVSSPPDSDMFAWPLAVVAENGRFVGYVMRKLKADQMKEWAHLAHTGTRREIAPEFDVRYAIVACLNYAIALESLHRAGHIQGDANESNSFVGADASVTIVDTDSAQIKSKNGQVFRCEVGKPEYTAAELIGKPLRDQDRTKATDAFAFGVLFFQMLTGGAHPTDGIYTGSDDPPSTTSKISQGVLPMLRDESRRGFKPVARIAVSGIPTRIKQLMLKLASINPEERPDFSEIVSLIKDVETHLEQCSKDKAHWFDSRDATCGWCQHADNGQIDPWGQPRASAQSKLPPVSFASQKQPTGKAPRASIAPPRHQSGYAPTAVQQSFQPSQPSTPLPQRQRHTVTPSGNLSPQAQQILNQANGNNSSSFNNTAPSPAPSPQKQIPEKIKGKMTVIYPDGSYGPRPPLGVLFNQNNKLWRQAIATEWPEALKVWWPRDRYLAKSLAIWLSPVIAAAVLILVNFVCTAIVFPNVSTASLQILSPLVMLGSLCSVLAFTIWWIGCWVGRQKAAKTYGSLDSVHHESVPKTLFRSVGIVFGYIFTPVIVGIAILVVLVKTMIKGDRQVRSRW